METKNKTTMKKVSMLTDEQKQILDRARKEKQIREANRKPGEWLDGDSIPAFPPFGFEEMFYSPTNKSMKVYERLAERFNSYKYWVSIAPPETAKQAVTATLVEIDYLIQLDKNRMIREALEGYRAEIPGLLERRDDIVKVNKYKQSFHRANSDVTVNPVELIFYKDSQDEAMELYNRFVEFGFGFLWDEVPAIDLFRYDSNQPIVFRDRMKGRFCYLMIEFRNKYIGKNSRFTDWISSKVPGKANIITLAGFNDNADREKIDTFLSSGVILDSTEK